MNLAIFHVSRVFSLFTPAWTPTRLTSNSNEFVNVKSHAQTEVTNYGSQDTAEDKMNHVILSNVARFNESSHIQLLTTLWTSYDIAFRTFILYRDVIIFTVVPLTIYPY